MAGNPVSDIDNEALAMGEDLADGLHILEVPLGVTGVTEAKTRAAITLCHTADKDVGDAKKARQAASTALLAVDETAMEFISVTRKVLGGFLGEHWSAAWEPTGFPDQSTALPRTQEKRLNLCRSLKEYFTANAGQEVAALGVTAAIADTNYAALSDGRELLAQKDTDQGVKLKARTAAYDALRKLLRTAVTELKRFLADDDDRWHTFNLNAPADPVTPDPVELVTLTPGTAGVIVASWERARRASRYRPFVQVVGVDEEFVARNAVHDLTVNLTGFTTGQTVKVYIVAANDDGEAPASPTAQIVVQ
ncbi:MAG: fibronectin type III domain-containing protein [Verrucomicrobiota bacterium]